MNFIKWSGKIKQVWNDWYAKYVAWTPDDPPMRKDKKKIKQTYRRKSLFRGRHWIR